MNRYFFYILVALLTFGISSAISFDFYLQDDTQNIKTPITDQTVAIRDFPLTPESEKIEYTCDIEIIDQLETYLKTSEFVQRLSTIDSDFNRAGKVNCADLYEIKTIDLNRDKKNEVIIMAKTSGLCNMHGNCELWGFTKTKNGYRQILRHEWAFEYKISSKFTKRFADIEIKANPSNGDPSNYLHVFKYDGKAYQMKYCFAEYESDTSSLNKKTKRVPEKCEQ